MTLEKIHWSETIVLISCLSDFSFKYYFLLHLFLLHFIHWHSGVLWYIDKRFFCICLATVSNYKISTRDSFISKEINVKINKENEMFDLSIQAQSKEKPAAEKETENKIIKMYK